VDLEVDEKATGSLNKREKPISTKLETTNGPESEDLQP
jgi:hypothetical protein